MYFRFILVVLCACNKQIIKIVTFSLKMNYYRNCHKLLNGGYLSKVINDKIYLLEQLKKH